MKIKKTPVTPFREEVLCDVCGNGTMNMTGQAIQSKKVLYVHVCTNKDCLHTENYEVNYPRIIFENVGGADKKTPDLKKL